VRCPARRGSDVDFLLFKKGKRPLLGSVECEGPDKGFPAGVAQLKRYVAGFRGGGKAIYREFIKDAFDPSKKRCRVNALTYRSWVGGQTRVLGEPSRLSLDVAEL